MKSIISIMKRSFLVVSTTLFFSSMAHADSLYFQELKSLKKEPVYQAILDRKADFNVRTLAAKIKESEEVGLIGQVLRAPVSIGAFVVKKTSMPQLYAYVEGICRNLQMRMPTIYITNNKTSSFGADPTKTNSVKFYWSSGAILIGQDLLQNVSQQAVEAAICVELSHIKNNHMNKQIFVNWIVPQILAVSVPDESIGAFVIFHIGRFVLPRLVVGKMFEREADNFVIDTMQNAQGFIELCSYWQAQEQKVDADYDEVYAFLQSADISMIDTVLHYSSYAVLRTIHRANKLQRWIKRVTPLTGSQQYQVRIDRAKEHLAEHAQA